MHASSHRSAHNNTHADTNSQKMHSTSTDKHSHRPNSRLNQSNFKGESEQSGHPNYGVWCGKLVRHLRKTLIKTPGCRVQWWSGSLHLQLIWKHEIANSWPSNAVCTIHEVSPVNFCVRAPQMQRKDAQALPVERVGLDHKSKFVKQEV